MYPDKSTRRIDLELALIEANAMPHSEARSQIIHLITQLQQAEKERNEYYERLEIAMQTGRIRLPSGEDTLIRATPPGAHVVIRHDLPAVIGNFDNQAEATTWAEKNLTSSVDYSVVSLSPAE